MSKQYSNKKSKKSSSIKSTEMKSINQTKEIKMDIKNSLISVFKSIMDILRDNEALVGPKALSTWTPLLILKMIEPHFGDEIDIDGYDYDFSDIQEEMIEKHKIKLLQIVRFSNLSNEEEDNIPSNMKYLWEGILSKHPSTKNIFLEDKGILIKNKSTYKKIIDKINLINLNVDNDLLGDAYEEIFKDIMVGKTFGQFFTQPLVKKMMVKLINPQIHPDGKIDTCGDPTMGTGGFLISYLQDITKKAKNKNIKPDWDFIKTEGLYGKELDEDTYQLAVSNMLISSGHMFETLDRGDSIRDPITRKFDNILANPPFGIKGLKYDDFQSPLKSEYVPIKSDNAVSLFIQAIIYMLKINGKCAVVLPDGQDLFSKTNKNLIAVREYLMKTCDLKEIIYLPSGIFTYTSIKTCVFYFVKKVEGTDVLEVDVKYSKTTQKETKRNHKFSKTHETTKVDFYDYNPYEDVKNLLVEVPIDKIVSNSYSLNYAEYMKDETEEDQYEEGVVVKTLGEVCKDISTSKNIPSSNRVDGTYRFFTCSREETTHNEYHYDGTFIIHGSRGSTIKESVFMTNNEKFAIGTSMFISEVKNINECISKYIYYYLRLNQQIFSKYINGTAIPMISKSNYYDIKIPIPSLERQQEIVKYLDFIYEKANKTSNEKIVELKQLNEYCLNNQKIFGENVVKELGEICEVNQGNSLTKTEMIDGIYDVIGGGKIIGKHNEKNRDGNNFTLTRVGDININYIDRPYYLTDNGFSLKSKQEDIMTKYLYYLLSHNKNNLTNLYQGTAQKVISKTNLKSIKIPIPSLERQKDIVEYCEYNDTLIKQLEEEIEINKEQAQQFITNIVKAQEQEQTVSIDEVKNQVKDETVSNKEKVVDKPKLKVKKIGKKVKKSSYC